MRLHLPLKLRSVLIASMAALAGLSTSYSADSISIDLGSDYGTLPEGTSAGYIEVGAEYWNKAVGAASSSELSLIDSNGNDTGATATWYSPNLWANGDASLSGTDGMMYGYIDDSSSAYTTVTVENISYLSYDVYIYCNTDNGEQFSFKIVNGTYYTWDENSSEETGATAGAYSGWGTVGTTGDEILGVNTLLVKDQSSSTLTIETFKYDGRGCITGIQIVDTYDGTQYVAVLDGTPVTWTATNLGSSDWTDATADISTVASLSVTSPTTVTIDGTRTAEALTANGGEAILEGGALS